MKTRKSDHPNNRSTDVSGVLNTTSPPVLSSSPALSTAAAAAAAAAAPAPAGTAARAVPSANVRAGGFGRGYRKDAATPEAAVAGLLGRLGFDPLSFTLDASLAPTSTGLDTMQLSSSGGKVVLRGSSGVGLASAANWYLNDFCNTTYDWNTYAPQIPARPVSRSIPPQWGTSRLRPLICTYTPHGAYVVRVDDLVKSLLKNPHLKQHCRSVA